MSQVWGGSSNTAIALMQLYYSMMYTNAKECLGVLTHLVQVALEVRLWLAALVELGDLEQDAILSK